MIIAISGTMESLQSLYPGDHNGNTPQILSPIIHFLYPVLLLAILQPLRKVALVLSQLTHRSSQNKLLLKPDIECSIGSGKTAHSMKFISILFSVWNTSVKDARLVIRKFHLPHHLDHSHSLPDRRISRS